MYLFTEPECEAIVDQRACAQEDQCAHNAGCMRISQCWNACEAQRKTLPPATGAGCGCFPNCFPQGAQTPGYVEFMRVIGVLQGGMPSGLSCRSGC